MNLQNALLQAPQDVHGRDRSQRVDQIAPVHAAQEFALRSRRGISQMHAHQKSVQLRLGQGKGARLVLRVLRGDDEEWFGQRHRLAVERHLMLFHGLEQRALGLWRGAIDFIGQHELGKNRSALKSELTGFAIKDGHTEHVGGQQIAGELHPLKRQPQGLRKCVRERGFTDSRNIFDQEVSARQQTCEAQANLRVLAQDHSIDLGENGVDLGLCRVHWPLSAVTLAIWAAN